MSGVSIANRRRGMLAVRKHIDVGHCSSSSPITLWRKKYLQELDVIGQCKVVVLEALKCPSPELNHGEDNAAFKSVFGTLLKCPWPGQCNNPLLCSRQFFQSRHPRSDDDASAFTCRHQWKARRAEIEYLAREAERKSNEAKRIPVLADVALLRSHRAASATKPGNKATASLGLIGFSTPNYGCE